MVGDSRVVVIAVVSHQECGEVLIAHLLREKEVIDECRICIEHGSEVTGWAEGIKSQYPDWATIVFRKESVVRTESATIYISLDGIVYLEEGYVEETVRFKQENPQHSVILGNVVNTSMPSHMHQRIGAIDWKTGIIGWNKEDRYISDPMLSEKRHNEFLNAVKDERVANFHFSRAVLLYYEESSCVSMCWSGDDFREYGGSIGGQGVERCFSVDFPRKQEKPVCIFGGKVSSFYSPAGHHRDYLDSTIVLNRYRELVGLPPLEQRSIIKALLDSLPKGTDLESLRNVLLRAGMGWGARGQENHHNSPLPLSMFCNSGMGLEILQTPHQFSECMKFLVGLNPKSYLEIGTGRGGTFILTVWLLSRCCGLNTAVGLDINPPHIRLEMFKQLYPFVETMTISSLSSEFSSWLEGKVFDVAFIDGGHDHREASNDLMLMKKHAKVIVIHDIVDNYFTGTRFVWNQLKNETPPERIREFTHQYEEAVLRTNRLCNGVGVYINEL